MGQHVLIASTVTISNWNSEDQTDIAAVARLFGELGYPVDPEPMAERLVRFEVTRGSIPIELLIARETASEQIVGFALVTVVTATLEMEIGAVIQALVVDSRQRGKQIGQQLVEAAEEWARNKDAVKIRLSTNVNRDDAHRFYERIGYEHVSTSRSYSKTLSSEIKD